MKKQLKIKSTNGRGLQAFGVMSAILATLVSFAYLMPEDSTAETIQASATGTTTAVTTASVVDSSSSLTTSATHTTHTTAVRTITSTSTATTSTIPTTTSSALLTTTTTSTTSTSESTTVSSETQTSPIVTSATETSYFSEPALTTAEVFTERALESIVICTDESSHDHDEYYDHDDYDDYEDDYYDDDENEIYGEKTYLGTFRITHYCPCSQCCGEYTGLTASGTVATAGRTVSSSDQFDFGTQLEIDGIVYTVEDRGGFSYDTIDIFCDTHEEALEKGTYYADVYIVE